MALLFMDSFDHYTQASDKYTFGGGDNIVAGRHGNGWQAWEEIRMSLQPADSRCIVGAAWHFNGSLSGPLFQLRAHGQLNALAWLQVATDGALQVGLTGADGIGLTWYVVRSAVDVVKLHQWHFIELDITFSLTADANPRPIIDVVRVYVDGLAVIDATGPLGPGDAITEGYPATVWTTIGHGAIAAVLDDFYVCDGAGPAPWNAPLGDVQIDVIRPNGAGAVTEWTPVGAASNWDATNDPTPDDDTTKVVAATSGLSDLYAMEDINTSNGIIGAQLLINARRTEEGVAALTPLLRHAGVTTPLVQRSLSPTYFYRNRDVFVTMPNSDPLTDANVNALQAGVTRTL